VCGGGGEGGSVMYRVEQITDFAQSTVELHFARLVGMRGHTDMQKFRIIGFSLKIAYIGSLKWEKNIQTSVLDCIFIYLQLKQYTIPCMYLTHGRKIEAIKRCGTLTV
jgi:hypothetical protein